MKYIKQFGIILAFSFIGEAMRYFIDLPVPASIYGLLLMFLCLKMKIIPISAVKETAKFLIEIMPIMFIPAAVGLLDSWHALKPIVVPVAIVTVISTICVMAVSGKTTQWVINKSRNLSAKNVMKDGKNKS